MAAALRRVRGVSSASADRRGAIVYRDPRTCSDQSLIDAVRRAGYSARIAKNDRCRIRVDMTCDGCSRRVSSALLRVRGVKALALERQQGMAEMSAKFREMGGQVYVDAKAAAAAAVKKSNEGLG